LYDELCTDNSSEFRGVNTVVHDLLASQHEFATPYNPRGNSVAERAIGTCGSSLTKMLEGDTGQWVNKLPGLQLAVNWRTSKDVPFSGFSAMFCRQPRRPEEALNGGSECAVTEDKEVGRAAYEPADVAARMTMANDVIWPAIVKKRAEVAAARKSKFDERPTTSAAPFRLGQLVYTKNVNRKDKLEPFWEGPYQITALQTRDRYSLQDATGVLLQRDVKSHMMKDCSTALGFGTSATISAIIDHRGVGGSIEYLVRWKGATSMQDEWLPASHIDDHSAIRAYFARRPSRTTLAGPIANRKEVGTVLHLLEGESIDVSKDPSPNRNDTIAFLWEENGWERARITKTYAKRSRGYTCEAKFLDGYLRDLTIHETNRVRSQQQARIAPPGSWVLIVTKEN